MYAEQLSGSAFTAPRTENVRTWFYRIHPSACHKPFQRCEDSKNLVSNWHDQHPNPNQFRWMPFDVPSGTQKVDFVQGLHTICGAGDTLSRHGIAIHVYLCSDSMKDKAFYNADGDFLIGEILLKNC